MRLFGIDSPERGQPGDAEATTHLRKLIGAARPDCAQIDYDRRNKRPVSICIANGVNLNVEMVRAARAVVWCSFISKLQLGSPADVQGGRGGGEGCEARDMGAAVQAVAGVGVLICGAQKPDAIWGIGSPAAIR